jgi:subtilase family serine protease
MTSKAPERGLVRHGTRLRAIGVAGAASLLAAGVVAATGTIGAAAAPGPARTVIAGSHPSWATAAALVSGRLLTGRVTANVYLAPRNGAGLDSIATAVSTPGNALYRKYLTNSQLLSEFAPTQAQAAAVEHWLTGSGMSVAKVVGGIGGYVQATGSIKAAATAFGVTFGSYRLGSKIVRATEQAASAPAAVAADVLTVTGLDTAPGFMRPMEKLPPPPQNYFVAPNCSSFYGQKLARVVPGTKTAIPAAYGRTQPWTNCGYTMSQIRGAYHVGSSGGTGKGVTVAVVDAYAAPTMLKDANEYAKVTGDKGFRPGQYKQVLLGGKIDYQFTAPDECDAAGWYGEETLDVEAVHGMAPDANVTYVGARSCQDIDLSTADAYIVNHHTADIVNNSWGAPYNTTTAQPLYDFIFKAGAAEGIGFFFSSGDNGYEDPAYEDPGSSKIQVDFPTSSPWVTSVGGTSLAIGKNKNYEFETGWGTELDPLASSGTWAFNPPGTVARLQFWYAGSAGGGVSTAYTQPSYQKGVVPAALARDVPQGKAAGPMRVVPDVSALADPSTGMLVGETLYGTDKQPHKTAFYLSRIGGTSVASPIFSGIEADASQAAGHPLGFANPLIYSLDKANSATRAFNDVTDKPFGSRKLAEVRSNYTDPSNKVGPLVTYLRTLGYNGVGVSKLSAVKGYDDDTGVGSPDFYIQAVKSVKQALR